MVRAATTGVLQGELTIGCGAGAGGSASLRLAPQALSLVQQRLQAEGRLHYGGGVVRHVFLAARRIRHRRQLADVACASEGRLLKGWLRVQKRMQRCAKHLLLR